MEAEVEMEATVDLVVEGETEEMVEMAAMDLELVVVEVAEAVEGV